jgi:hypothetical protein
MFSFLFLMNGEVLVFFKKTHNNKLAKTKGTCDPFFAEKKIFKGLKIRNKTSLLQLRSSSWPGNSDEFLFQWRRGMMAG